MPTKRFHNLRPERRGNILDAARNEFIRHGYEGASLNTIIREAGISKGSLYYYFEDKLDLYMAVISEAIGEIMDPFGDIIKGNYSDDFWSDWKEIADRFLKIVIEKPDVMKLMRGLVYLYNAPNRPEQIIEFMNLHNSSFAGMLKHGVETGAVRDDIPFELLFGIMNAIHDVFDIWFMNHIDDVSEKELARVMDVYYDMFKSIAEKRIIPEKEALCP